MIIEPQGINLSFVTQVTKKNETAKHFEYFLRGVSRADTLYLVVYELRMAISKKYAVRLRLHSGYRSSLITPSSRRIGFLPKNCPNSSRGNQKYPRKKEKILRKYQMKLRKNEMEVRKNFSFPRWINQNIYG